MRPDLKIPRSSIELILEIIAFVSLVLTLAFIAIYWNHLPSEIAIHFDITGKVDGWARKETILLFPVASIFVYAILTIVSFFPHKYNYLWEITEENAKRQYQLARLLVVAIKIEELVLIAFVTWSSIQISLSVYPQLQVSILFFAIFIIGTTVGAYLIKAYLDK
jgi:uncharacterized membrane protein